MDYHCEVCNLFVKSRNHINLDKHKHIKLTIDNPNIDNIDEIFTLILMNIICMNIILLDVNINCVILIGKAMELLGVFFVENKID